MKMAFCTQSEPVRRVPIADKRKQCSMATTTTLYRSDNNRSLIFLHNAQYYNKYSMI